MPYNYKEAFDVVELSLEQRKQLAVGAILTFQNEFPHIDLLNVAVLPNTKHVEVEGGGEYRVYSWEALGFEL